MAVAINKDSLDTVGDVAYDLLGIFQFLWPFAHMQPFNFTHQF